MDNLLVSFSGGRTSCRHSLLQTAKDILSESKVVDFKTFVDQRYLDMQNGCEDSCEVFSTESDIEGMLNDS